MKSFLARNKLILKFMSLAVCGGISVGVSQIAVNLYAIYLGASSSQIGLIGGLPGMSVVLTVLPMGFLIDRFGARRLFIIGCLFGALIYLFLPLADSPRHLLIFVTLLGFFMSFRFVSMSSVFLDYLREIGNDKAGWYRGSHSIGMVFLGPILGSYLVKHINYNWTFYSISLFLIVTVIIARIVLSDKQKDNTMTAFSFNSTFSHLKSLLKNKDLVEASLAESLAIMAFSSFNTFMVAIALRTFHFSKETAALFLSTQGAVFILSVFLLDALLKRIGQKRFYLFSISVVILGLILLGAAKTPVYLWIGTVFLGIGLGMLNIINVSRLANIDAKKGKIAGFFSLFTMAGGILGPILGGFIGSIFGLQTIFLVLIPLFFILGLKIYFKSIIPAKGFILGGIFPLILLIFWETATRLKLFPSQLLVPPKQVVLTFVDLLRRGDLIIHLRISLMRVVAGFLLGITSGFILGTAMGLSKRLERYIYPFFNLVRQIPLLGWMPLLMLWFGVGELFKIVFIAIGAFYPMVLNTFEGIRNVPKEYMEVAKVFEYGKLRLLQKVILPTALPSIFTGIKLGLSMSWMLVVGAELVAASEGIGYLMTWGRQLFQFDIVMLGVIIIGIIGLFMNNALGALEVRFLRWRRTYNAE